MPSFTKSFNKTVNIIPYFIIALGCLLRLSLFLQNRSMIVDEANVARNIYERGFHTLLLPLNYQQFAPPGFLWALKFFTNTFGYSEYAFRLYPVLCSICSLILLYYILKHSLKTQVSWYALLLFATGLFFIRYATEVKQYSSDIMIALSLLLLALKFNLKNVSFPKFILLFGIAGSIAVWCSMPSIFILSALGAYYFYLALRDKSWKEMLSIICIVAIWIGQFLIYYNVLLKSQIHSDYLQTWHSIYFPALIPITTAERVHSLSLYGDVFSCLGGDTTLAITFNLLLFFAGLIYLLIKDLAKGILLITPIICLYVAAGIHQFTLLPRVVLFIMPIVLIIMTIGLQQLFNIKFAAIKIILTAIAVICFINFNEMKYLFKPFEVEDFKGGLNIVQQQNIKGSHFHISFLLNPVYIYYLDISPQKKQWTDLANADILSWDTNYDSLAQTFSTKDAVIYTWLDDDDLNKELASFRKYAKQDGILCFTGGKVYLFTRLTHTDSISYMHAL